MPRVGLLPDFSHLELVIQALTLPVAPLSTLQLPQLHGGCSRACLGALGRKACHAPVPFAHHSSQHSLGSGDVTPLHGGRLGH